MSPSLCSTLVKHHLEYCVQAVGVGPDKNIKMIRGLEHISCEESEGAGIVQHREEKALGSPHWGLSLFNCMYYKGDGEHFFPGYVALSGSFTTMETILQYLLEVCSFATIL